ncbi:MAG: hypothetical protein RLZZ412_141 [Verrucomicrobiota bacterium]
MRQKNRSRGFSLILSLTVMACVVMLLVTLSAFITIESRAAMNQQLATRARLNALVSMRLALAHLQQEAGADRRATARADITQPGVSAGSLRNPMWTGVWRTDKPDLPPAWLVSGLGDQPAGTQTVSLFQTGSTPDYPAGYWAPWQTPPVGSSQDMIELVGLGSALPAAGTRPSGIISLPKVTLPDDETFGRYAYWIGDEGVKARINLADGRSAAASAADRLIALRSPVVAGLTGVKGLNTLTRPEQLGHIDTARQLTLLSGFNSGAASDPDPITNPEKTYFHDLSFVSAGVIADSFHGGLRRDLSRAFELSDDAFANTEFGEGRNVTGGNTPDGAAGTHTGNGFAGRTLTSRSDDPLMMAIVTGTTGNSGGSTGNGAAVAAPVFSRTTTAGQVRGPAWWALRDYHRLYQQLGWSSGAISGRGTTQPELLARTFWPNAAVSRPSGNPEDSGIHDNGIRNRAYSYSDVYNGDLNSTINPNASDFLNGDKGRLVTRPLHVAATPYIHRTSLAFSFTKTSFTGPAPRPLRGTITRFYLYLNVTPIVVVHNPYNVRMRWRPTSAGSPTTDAYPAVVCLSGMEDWNLVLRQPGAFYSKPLTQLLRVNGRSAEKDDTFRIYLRGDINNPDIVLEPGEFRVFSCQPVAANMSNISGWSQATAATNQLTVGRALEIDEIIDSPAGGSYDEGIDERITFTAEIASGQNLRMRHALDCWPGDRLELKKDGTRTANDQLSFFLNSSEHSELVITQGPMTAAGRTFSAGINDVPLKYVDGSQLEGTGPTRTPAPFAVIDIEAKSANEDRAPFPLFTHSNPMAGSLRASGAGRTAAGANNGTRGAPASFTAKVRSCDSWEGIIQQPADNRRAFGGYSVKSDKGSERAILTEIPLVQPTSLAQYAHANFGVRDQQPLLSIGNSFASPLVDATKVFQDNGPNWTEFDQTYLLNAALWDGFFLSSVAPWMKTDNTTAVLPDHPGYKVTTGGDTATAPINQVKSIAQVIESFVLDGTPLDNPRFSIERSGASDEAIIGALDDYRRSASVLLNQGAFNVNSTSLEAWKAFLGNAKQQALQGLASDAPRVTANARFVRAVTRQDSVPADGNAEDTTNWQGFANLSDAQIEKLAKAIIAENKERFTVSVRGERDQTNPPGTRRFAGHDKSTTPYLGLAEFINRFLCPQAWANRCGALQAAIFRADADDAAGLSDRLYGGIGSLRLNAASLNTSETPWFRHPDNIEVGNGGRVHTALSAPGNLLQSDLLQSLGSALATRSDTFTLRCFGEAVLPGGETGVAWMEVVVQRTPEFIDRADPAETGSSAAKPLGFGAPTSTDPTTNRNLSLINHLLGRRFKVTSMRWLKTDEI